MNVRLKPFSIFVIGALLLSIGVMGGCTSFRGVSRSEILTNHHFTAIRRTDPNDASKAVWVVKPQAAVTKRWSDKGEPDLVALSPETFKGTLEVTFGAPEDNKVIVTAKATAKRTWRNPWLLWNGIVFPPFSEALSHTATYTYTCDKQARLWSREGGTSRLVEGGPVFAAVEVDHLPVKGYDDTFSVIIRVRGKYGCGPYRDQIHCSQKTNDCVTTYICRYGLVPDSSSK